MIFCRRLSNSSSIQSLPRPPSSLGFFRNLSGQSLNTNQNESPRNTGNRFLGKFSFVLHSFSNYNVAITRIFLECVTFLAYTFRFHQFLLFFLLVYFSLHWLIIRDSRGANVFTAPGKCYDCKPWLDICIFCCILKIKLFIVIMKKFHHKVVYHVID